MRMRLRTIVNCAILLVSILAVSADAGDMIICVEKSGNVKLKAESFKSCCKTDPKCNATRQSIERPAKDHSDCCTDISFSNPIKHKRMPAKQTLSLPKNCTFIFCQQLYTPVLSPNQPTGTSDHLTRIRSVILLI